MKKIITKTLVIFTMILSGFTLAQEESDNPYVYETTSAEDDVAEDFPGNPGDPAPIDQYVPVLLIIAASLVVVYANKKKTAE